MKSGIILVDKQVDYTSRDVVNIISGILHTKKVGHVGTLDPFATGLLVVTVNEGTKAGPFLEILDKTYIAKISLGNKTTTADKEGEIIETKPVPKLSKDIIEKAFKECLGKQTQIPPMYSAVKIGGVPLYKLARQGKEIDRKEREIEIYSLDLISFDENSITFVSHVSKGTYIRTLAEKISEKINCVGHVQELTRLKVGEFLLSHAKKVDDIKEDDIIPIEKALSNIPIYNIDIAQEDRFANGSSLKIFSNSKLIMVKSSNGKLAIYELSGDNNYICKRGFNL